MRPVTQVRTLAAGVVAAIAATQAPTINTPLLINGSLASGGVATMTAQQFVGLTSAGNLSAVNFTITGTDDQGRVISQTIAGPNANTVQTTLNYLTVTSIVPSATSAVTLTVDTVSAGASAEIPLDKYLKPFQVSFSVEGFTGTPNVIVEWTMGDVFGGAPGPFNWFVSSINGVSTNTAGSLISPVSAIRVRHQAAGTVTFRVEQAGMIG